MSVQDTRFQLAHYSDPHGSHQIKLETAHRQRVELKDKSNNENFCIS